MNLWANVGHLLATGYKSLFRNHLNHENGKVSNVCTFLGIPILATIITFYFNISAQSFSNDILTTLSIFLAITLGVIFLIPEKLSQKVEKLTIDDEARRNYIKRYKLFCSLFIKRLTFVLVLSVLLIIVSITLNAATPNEPISHSYINWGLRCTSSLIFGTFVLAILAILKLIVDIYIFLMDELKAIRD